MNKNKSVSISKTDSGFDVSFQFNNDRMNLQELIGYNMIDIIFEVNKEDIIDRCKTKVDHTDNNNEHGEANTSFVFKHLFKDVGLPKFYYNCNTTMKKTERETFVTSTATPKKECPFLDPVNDRYVAFLPITNMDVSCNFPTMHIANCFVKVYMDPNFHLPPSHEMIVISMFKKIFKKVKGFIETVV
tara:strand:+ start:18689 stop:19249 length:561 start_codon:yes stop_codon:yes gene_type:complete